MRSVLLDVARSQLPVGVKLPLLDIWSVRILRFVEGSAKARMKHNQSVGFGVVSKGGHIRRKLVAFGITRIWANQKLADLVAASTLASAWDVDPAVVLKAVPLAELCLVKCELCVQILNFARCRGEIGCAVWGGQRCEGN